MRDLSLANIESKILLIRNQKVMLSAHLAELYDVETRVLNQAVKRNIKRFPGDFMFRLKASEVESLVSQNVIPHKKYFGGSLPYAFTEQGVAMLSGILNSDRAIQVNIAIMRTFVRLRWMIASHKDLARKLSSLERKYDSQFRIVFEAIKELMAPPAKKKRKIGFNREGEN
ncbi:MAG: ORF6N domain-containing protein [Nitrospiraceae bacterium]|nr:MAG: ORF6N domain-containing protein [Nitrospiraceae bacterium]